MRPALLLSLSVLAVLPGCVRRAPPLPTGGSLLHYRIPWPDAFPSDVAVDGEGRVWFTDRLTHALGVFDPATEEFRRIPTPTRRSAPYGLLRAPDGSLWFGESVAGRLGRLDPATGEVTEVEIPGLRTGPRLLAWAGGAVWFTAERDGIHGRYDPGTGEVELWDSPVERPYGIAAVGDQVWVAGRRGEDVYRVDAGPPYSPVAVGAAVRRMAGSPDGWLWMTHFFASRVGGMSPLTDARLSLETLPRPSRPYGIAVDTWGRVWYSEQGNETIVVYDPAVDERRKASLPLSGGTVRSIAIDDARRRVWLPLSDIGVLALLTLDGGTPP